MQKLALAAIFIPTLAIAGDPKAPPAKPTAPPAKPAVTVPPEVKATVDAFKGNWSFDASVTAPGLDKPVTFKITYACKPIAGGVAVSCDAKAKGPSGPFEGTFVAAYDPYSKAVHFIGITNSYEVHDHSCQWKGTDLVCAPLKSGTGPNGDEITEEVKIQFDKNACTFTSTTRAKDGATTVFEGKGKR